MFWPWKTKESNEMKHRIKWNVSNTHILSPYKRIHWPFKIIIVNVSLTSQKSETVFKCKLLSFFIYSSLSPRPIIVSKVANQRILKWFFKVNRALLDSWLSAEFPTKTADTRLKNYFSVLKISIFYLVKVWNEFSIKTKSKNKMHFEMLWAHFDDDTAYSYWNFSS